MIYLDNAATTPPDGEALARAAKEYEECYFNPSARYRGGFAAHTLLEEARREIVSHIADAGKYEAIFTSCGTEADNQAVFGGAGRGNAVTTAGEHAAVYESFLRLRERGTEVRFAPIRGDGSLDAEAFLSLVDEKTSFVSVVHVNNETGAVNDIIALARAVKKKNPRCIFHSDGVQAYGKLPFRLSEGIDLYSVSAHKLGGLKGTGALLRRKGCTLRPYLFGGGQEGGMRSGTENVLGILDFRYAAEGRFASLEEDYGRIKALRTRMKSLLDPARFGIISPEEGSPYLLSVYARGLRGEVLQRVLYDRGLAVGTGSACSSKKPHSRILEAAKVSSEALDGVLRISFSARTDEEEVCAAARLMNEAAEEYANKV